MPITVTATPSTLSWTNFVTAAHVIDPADGTSQLSYTTFIYAIEEKAPRVIDGKQAMAETFKITLRPDAKIKTGAAKTADLLAHEQFHYDVGLVCARRLAMVLPTLRGDTVPDLVAAFQKSRDLHMDTRVGLIQERYDKDTDHGTKPHYQKIWKDAMKTVLANPKSTKILGYFL